MSHMKIVPLIAAAQADEQRSRAAALHNVVGLLEAQFGVIRYEAQLLKDAHSEITHNAVAQQRASRALYQLIYELQQRVTHLEQGRGCPPALNA